MASETNSIRREAAFRFMTVEITKITSIELSRWIVEVEADAHPEVWKQLAVGQTTINGKNLSGDEFGRGQEEVDRGGDFFGLPCPAHGCGRCSPIDVGVKVLPLCPNS